jgi:predicted alpha/beta-fold hydrolase
MKWLACALFILGACSHHSATIIENDEHPFSDPVLATFSSLAYTPQSPFFKPSLTRFDVRLDGFRKALPLWYWEAPNAEVLFVLLPGFGSSPDSLIVQATAETLWLQGFSVLSIPSNTHALFAQAASVDRRPGYLPRDLRELHIALDSSLKVLQKTHKNPLPKRLALAGLSYGALQTILWSQLAQNEKGEKIPFEAFVALNPPTDLSYALAYLDSKFVEGQNLYLDSSGQLQAPLAQKIKDVEARRLLVPEVLGAFQSHELEFLLAWDFRHSLIQATLWPSQDPRTLDFAKYIHTLLIPSIPSPNPLEKWRKSNSIIDHLNPVPRSLLVFHSLDDTLVRKEDVLALKVVMNSQMQLYRYGGHLGYIGSERFRRDIAESLRSLRISEREAASN